MNGAAIDRCALADAIRKVAGGEDEGCDELGHGFCFLGFMNGYLQGSRTTFH